MKKNILIVGVGGQGTLLASRIIGKLAENYGSDVKLSEVHGMAQRGGSVVTHVKIAERVYSPVIAEGGADYIVAFEKSEAARYTQYLKDGGTIIVNTQEILPMPVITGAAVYPSDTVETLKKSYNVIDLDALKTALDAGGAKSVNVVMLGVLFAVMGIPEADASAALAACVKPQFADVNKKALHLGYTA
ncbi:MAG: indolepyruvate oxidoreductase subunit beta [Clostridiales bacterium]|jgi:indolepyruvate ferredoxin oxidoreductase beta subunit|nr:indolepyruvate oxidoreductase subunit beta [Clostridiales bacterium]